MRGTGGSWAWLLIVLALAGCDDTSTGPRPKEPDAAVSGSGGEGGGGSGGSTSGSGGSGGQGGTGGCSGEPVAPPIMPAELPDAALGKPYLQLLTVPGARASQVRWNVDVDLPEGLTLVPETTDSTAQPPKATATLSGTPRVAGTFHFEVSVTLQSSCPAAPARAMYSLVVIDDDGDGGM